MRRQQSPVNSWCPRVCHPRVLPSPISFYRLLGEESLSRVLSCTLWDTQQHQHPGLYAPDATGTSPLSAVIIKNISRYCPMFLGTQWPLVEKC